MTALAPVAFEVDIKSPAPATKTPVQKRLEAQSPPKSAGSNLEEKLAKSESARKVRSKQLCCVRVGPRCRREMWRGRMCLLGRRTVFLLHVVTCVRIIFWQAALSARTEKCVAKSEKIKEGLESKKEAFSDLSNKAQENLNGRLVLRTLSPTSRQPSDSLCICNCLLAPLSPLSQENHACRVGS